MKSLKHCVLSQPVIHRHVEKTRDKTKTFFIEGGIKRLESAPYTRRDMLPDEINFRF